MSTPNPVAAWAEQLVLQGLASAIVYASWSCCCDRGDRPCKPCQAGQHRNCHFKRGN